MSSYLSSCTHWPKSQIQKGINGACTDDMKGMKSVIIDWITPKGQALNPHIPSNVKSGRGFNHEHTGALLCPTGLNWNNMEYIHYLISFRVVQWHCHFKDMNKVDERSNSGRRWSMACFSICKLYVWSWGPLEWTAFERPPCVGGCHNLTLLLLLNHQSRHSNTSLHPPARWIKNLRPPAQAMYISMECEASQRHPSHMLPPRYVIIIQCGYSLHWVGAGPLCLDLCIGIFSHRSCHRLGVVLQQYHWDFGRSWWEGWSGTPYDIVEQVCIYTISWLFCADGLYSGKYSHYMQILSVCPRRTVLLHGSDRSVGKSKRGIPTCREVLSLGSIYNHVQYTTSWNVIPPEIIVKKKFSNT